MNQKMFSKVYKYLQIFGYVLTVFFLLITVTSFIMYPSLKGLIIGLLISGLMIFLYFFVLNRIKK